MSTIESMTDKSVSDFILVKMPNAAPHPIAPTARQIMKIHKKKEDTNDAKRCKPVFFFEDFLGADFFRAGLLSEDFEAVPKNADSLSLKSFTYTIPFRTFIAEYIPKTIITKNN